MDGTTIAILAGGAGRRLGGRDKGLEALDGRPLVAWVAAAARIMDPAARLLIVANRHREAYATHAPVIADAVPAFRGPLAGIGAALDACRTPFLLTLPVDCPQPPRSLAARCAEALAADTRLALAVAHDGARRQPLFALYRCALARGAEDAAASGQGVAHWQDSLALRELDFSAHKEQFRNLNSPDDFIRHAADP